MSYGYATAKNRQQGEDRYEADWQHYHQLQGAGAAWAETRIRTPYSLPYKRIYLAPYNDVGTVNSVCNGFLRCFYNHAEVFKIPLSYTFAGAGPGNQSTLPNTTAILQPGNQTGLAIDHPDQIMFSRIATTSIQTIMPIRLMLTCDEIVWTPVQQVAAAGNACTFLACLSLRDIV